MITNNVTVESQLATSAATFLKWEEVYIFCFLQSETLELGDPRIGTLPLCLPLVCVCLVALSSPSGAFSFHGDLICRGEFICSCLPPPPLSVHLCFLAASRPFALFIFLCLVPAPFQTQRPFSNVVPLSPLSPSLLPNLCWRLCCAHLLFPSSLDTCSVNVRLCVCVWDNVHVKKKGWWWK